MNKKGTCCDQVNRSNCTSSQCEEGSLLVNNINLLFGIKYYSFMIFTTVGEIFRKIQLKYMKFHIFGKIIQLRHMKLHIFVRLPNQTLPQLSYLKILKLPTDVFRESEKLRGK